MARDFIKVNTRDVNATQGPLLINYVQQLRAALELGTQVKAVMDHNQDGTVFTDLEALFGLPVGQGQAVYDLVNGSIGAMSGTFQNDDALQITRQVGVG